jgi:hypothetical protein
MRTFTFTTTLFAALFAFNCSANANFCPFCDAPSLTLAEQIEQIEHLLLGKWIGGEKPTNESAGTVRFEIVAVKKSKDNAFEVGQEIELPQYLAGEKDALFILMGPSTRLIDWHVPSEATMASWEYVSNVPLPVEGDQEKKVERLAYFLDFLQDAHITISNDAFGEFAAAPYEIIKPLSDRMPREKLRKWIMDPETPVTRLGLYGLLLGLCGKEEDAAAMEHKILHPDADFRLGIEGVMSGYLIITGEDGLKVLEQAKMHSKTYTNKDGEEQKLPFSETYAAMQTLRFMWSYEPDRIPKERLIQSMRKLLDRPELADLVIADLSRWKAWEVQQPLMEMYDKEDFDIPSIKRAIVRYMYYASTDVPEAVEGTEDAKELPAHAVSALKHLAALEAKDPKTVRDTKRFLID